MEYIDIFDENNNPTGQIKEKGKAHEEGDFHRTAHVWIVNDKNELLLQKRSANKKSHPNCWDISGAGHIKAGESVIDGAIRELKEELGIQLEEAVNVAKITPDAIPLQFESSGKIKNFFITFYCLKRNSSDVIYQESEIDKIVWLPLEETFELIKSGRTKFPKNYNYKEIFEKVRNICNNQEKGKERK